MYIIRKLLPAEATRTRRTLFESIVIVIVIARMTTNDQEWSLEPTRMIDSCSFGDSGTGA